MNDGADGQLRLLVAIASYGTSNDKYLLRLLDEYRAMPYSTNIVVLSNIPKELGDDVEVVVGLPAKHPWSLPFGHKRMFADRINEYDLFIYSEDDTLITQKNVEAFLAATGVLHDDEIAGFVRFEKDSQGDVFYPEVHRSYHWDSCSVRSRGPYTAAFFSNEHSACYLLTRAQLHRAIRSGGFLVDPHQGEYDLLVSAATDPYTQCGFMKLICISHLDDFLIHHLPNKYIGKLGLDAATFDYQVRALLRKATDESESAPLLGTHPEFRTPYFGKDYYEPSRLDLVGLIPDTAQTVLSIGCGWGATEESLAQSGKSVAAIALDPIISACAQARGVDIVEGDLTSALPKLSGRTFECLLISNVLHLLRDPASILVAVQPFLSPGATVIIAVPNLQRIPVLWRRWCGPGPYHALGDFARSGVHFTSRRTIRRWLERGGLRPKQFFDRLPDRAKTVCRGPLRWLSPLASSEIITVAVKE